MILRFMEGPRRGKSIKITSEDYTLGRDDSCDLLLDADGVSRVHGRIKKNGDSYVILDNDSTNGIYINGNKLQGPHELKDNDTIRISDYLMLFSSDDNLKDTAFMQKLDNVREEKVSTPPAEDTDDPQADPVKVVDESPDDNKATSDEVVLDFSKKKTEANQPIANQEGIKSFLSGSTGIMLVVVIILAIILVYIILTGDPPTT